MPLYPLRDEAQQLHGGEDVAHRAVRLDMRDAEGFCERLQAEMP